VDIPKLRTSLETIISGRKTIEAFEVENFFPSIGRRIMAFNARKLYQPDNKIQQILLAIEDVTERARLERGHAAAHERIGMLLQELTHRVKNSLQFIASMVRLEARSNNSVEAKAALERQPGYHRAPNLTVACKLVGISFAHQRLAIQKAA
jgi:hypothetical protein